MKITEADLAAVRAVLTGNKTLKEVAEEYNVRHSALVAATILMAAQRVKFARGRYTEALRALVANPGIPAGGWPQEDANEAKGKVYGDRLITASRSLGLHESPDRSGVITLQIVPKLEALLAEDPTYHKVAKRLYETRDTATSPAAQTATIAAGSTDETLGAQLRALHAAAGANRAAADAIYATLGDLLAKHFPEEK